MAPVIPHIAAQGARRGLLGVLALVLGLVVAGCGGADSEQDRVRAAVERYATAVDHGFFAEQCRLMSPARRQAEIERAVRDLGLARAPRTCLEALELVEDAPAGRRFQTDQERAFDDLDRARVTIDGDRAVVTELSVPAVGKRIVLVRRGDGWLVDEAG